ncbi:Uncharacterized protein APZ42_003228, partial [Daphnia magna]
MQRREEQTRLAPTIQVLHATTRALNRQLAMRTARPSQEMRVRDVLQPLRCGADAGLVPIRSARQRSATETIRHRTNSHHRPSHFYSSHMRDVETPSRATNYWGISTRNQAKVDV